MSSAYCNRSLRARLRSSFVRIAAAAATAALAAGCAGGGSQGNVLVPAGSGANGVAAAGNTVVRIYVPAGSQVNPGGGRPVVEPGPYSSRDRGASSLVRRFAGAGD
jgi:hypothetical protein